MKCNMFVRFGLGSATTLLGSGSDRNMQPESNSNPDTGSQWSANDSFMLVLILLYVNADFFFY